MIRSRILHPPKSIPGGRKQDILFPKVVSPLHTVQNATPLHKIAKRSPTTREILEIDMTWAHGLTCLGHTGISGNAFRCCKPGFTGGIVEIHVL